MDSTALVNQGDPDPFKLPPDIASYQLTVPSLTIASKFTEPDPHLYPFAVEFIVGKGLTVIVVLFEFKEEHTPDFTTALYFVVAVMFK